MHICKFFCSIVVHNKFNVFVMYNLVYQLQCSSTKFCSYNFVLKEATNNNDVTCVANIMLNQAPNSNDDMRVENNKCLTIMRVCVCVCVYVCVCVAAPKTINNQWYDVV